MESRPRSTPPEELLAHSAWVRRLALTLVGEAAAADDLVQQTWKAALEHPPAADRPLEPWLRRVLTNFARQRARSAGRRQVHESAAAPGESLPGPDELVERLDSQRALAEELGRLSEPLRTTVLLRYFEDLEPSEIARRQGLPAGTVRWRLKRGLDELRERLDRRFGERRIWALLLAPLARPVVPFAPGAPAPSGAATATSSGAASTGGAGAALTGVWIMSSTLKIAGGLAALAVAYLGLSWTGVLPQRFSPWPQEAPLQVGFRPLSTLAPAEEPASDVLAAPRTAPRQAPVTAASEVPEPQVVAAVETHVRLLAGVFDAAGAPLAGGHLRLQRPWSARSAASGADGGLQLQLEYEGLQNGLTILIERQGYASELARLRVEPGSEVHVGNFRLEPGGAISGRVVAADGRGLEGILVTTGATGEDPGRLEWQRYQFQADEAAFTRSESDGSFLLPGVREGFVRVWAAGGEWLASYSPPVEVRAGQESTGVTLTLRDSLAEHVVRGVVLDPSQEPLPFASLEFSQAAEDSSMTGSREADAQGRFEFVLQPRMRLSLVASDSAGRFGSVSVSDIAAGSPELVLRLPELRQAALLALDERGAPLERFEFRILTGAGERELLQSPTTDHPAGRATFALPSEPFELELAAPGYGLARSGTLNPAAVNSDIVIALAPLPGLRGTVRSGGVPIEGAQVRLYERSAKKLYVEHNGFVVRVDPSWRDETQSDAQGRFLLTPRTAGDYYVQATRDGFALGEVGPLSLVPTRPSDELVLELGRGGAIEGRILTPPGPDASGKIIGISRADGHARTQRSRSDGTFRFESLTPGPWQVRLVEEEIYALESSTSTTTARGHPKIKFDCEVEEGRTTRFDIDLLGRDAVRLSGVLQFDGGVPGAWQASLTTGQLFGASNLSEAALGLDGSFELIAPAPDSYRLLLMGASEDGGMQALTVPLELGKGLTPWNMDIATAALTIENVPPSTGSDPGYVYLWDGPGGVLCMTAILPDADGRCVLPRVPRGAGRIVDLSAQSRPVNDPSEWPSLATCDVRFGETNKVTLP